MPLGPGRGPVRVPPIGRGPDPNPEMDEFGVIWIRHPGESWQKLERVHMFRVTEDFLQRYRQERKVPTESELLVLPLGERPSLPKPEALLGQAFQPRRPGEV
jgi:hypothetical protein